MIRYEVLMLAVPEITKDETVELEKSLERSVKKANGSVLSFERWGKYRLAYPVKKNEYGVYFLARFEVDSKETTGLIQDIKAIFKLKLNNIVMRDMVNALSADSSLAYKRPESLEEAPSQEVDSFLRKNKMDGLAPSLNSNHADIEEHDGGENFELEVDEQSVIGG